MTLRVGVQWLSRRPWPASALSLVVEHWRDTLRGVLRGLVIVALQAANVVAIQQRSIVGTWVVSAAIAVAWLSNVHAASGSRAHRLGFVAGSACGSALIVALMAVLER